MGEVGQSHRLPHGTMLRHDVTIVGWYLPAGHVFKRRAELGVV
jgi:hypothetical protein